MKKIYVNSITKAKSYYKGFEDILHDLRHSERVVANAKEIAKSVGYQDPDFIELYAYWHDVARAQNIEPHEEAGAAMTRDDLLARGADQKVANLAYEAIRFHKSTANPITVEGKIIRDADKLDIFSVVRWENIVKADKLEEYAEELKKTIDNLYKYPDVFTYDYTKKLYDERLPAFLDFCDSIST